MSLPSEIESKIFSSGDLKIQVASWRIKSNLSRREKKSRPVGSPELASWRFGVWPVGGFEVGQLAVLKLASWQF